MVVQLLPLLMEYLIFTLAMDPEEVQVMFRLDPTTKLSPPLGQVTVILPVAEEKESLLINTSEYPPKTPWYGFLVGKSVELVLPVI